MRISSINRVTVSRYTIISLITILFMSLSFIGFSNISEIDSLLLLINKAPENNKPEIYLSLANKLRGINIDSSENFAALGYKYALANKDSEMIVKHSIILAGINGKNGNYNKALSILTEAEQLCIEEKMFKLLVIVKITYGNICGEYYNYANTIKAYQEALNIVKEKNIIQYKSLVYHKLGNFFIQVNDYDNAYRYLKKATQYLKNDLDKSIHINNLISLGNLFNITNKYDSSIYCYKMALSIAQKYGNPFLIYNAYTSISNYYVDQSNYIKAFRYIDSAIVVVENLNKNHQLAKAVTKKAHIFSLQDDYKNTLKYNLEALHIRKKLGDKSYICSSCISIGNNYTELKNYDSALFYLNKGINIAKDINRIEFISYGYSKFVNYYKSQGNFKKAIKYTLLESKYQDSILIKKTTNQVQFFLSQFNLEKEKTHLDLLKIKKKNNLITFLIIIILIAVLMILLLIIINHLSKKATEEVEKLSNVIETTSQAVTIAKINGSILYVNDGLLKMGNYSHKNDILNESIFDFLNEQGNLILKNEIFPSLLNKGKWIGEIKLRKKNGTYLLTASNVSIIKSDDNKSEFIVNIFTDITSRKIAENKLRKSSEKLRIAVQTRDKMFSIIAHDLTGPFSSILGFSKLLATEYGDYQNEDHIRFSQLIYESSKNTFDLLTNLLHWSRSQLGNIDLIFEQTNLYSLLSENIDPLRLMLKQKEISLHNEVNSEITVLVDINTFGIVVRNLLTNAIKFTPRGGAIRIASNNIDNNINIVFSDTGIGIKSESIARLFDVNNNASTLGTEDEKGTGLGLLLCKEFTELNNGTISVESEFGIGSRFAICFPSQ